MKLRKMKRSMMGFSLIAALGVSFFSTGTGVLPTVKAAEREEAVTTSEDVATSSDADALDVTETEEEILVEDTLEVEANQIRINAANFPDENFRKYIKKNFDKNNDNIVDNIANIKSMEITTAPIYNLKGIEHFGALESLSCDYIGLTSLDVSKNTALKMLWCKGNKLTSLDVSKNTALESLDCEYNALTSLDVGRNTALKSLYCNSNELTSLDVSKNTVLKDLNCGSNELTSLDVGKNTALKYLTCDYNRLTSLDVSKNIALESLTCGYNRLASLDVSKNTALKMLWCKGNKLTSLDVSKNTAVAYLNCDNNDFTSLDVSKNTVLTWLSIDSNITADISNLNLSRLEIYVPQVKGTIDLSGITGIEKYMSGSGWNGNTKKLTYGLEIKQDGQYANYNMNDRVNLILSNVGWFSRYQKCDFYKDLYGNVTCKYSNGNPVINEFKCDGTYTYYFQLDGTAMRNRLTYHPDGEHVIYFDENGHEVFSNFHHVEKSIAGEAVDDLCFFDVYGYMYVDVMTYDQAGQNLYYVNPYGVIERGNWFEFSDTCVWAGTTNKVGKGYGYAYEDGTLMINTYTYNWIGRYVYMQGNGHMQ